MIYEQTKKKQVDAIIWTGENTKEIRDFLPPGMYKFEQDHITQLLSLIVVDMENKKYYQTKWGDYIVHFLDSNKYVSIPKKIFEEEYTEYRTLHSSDNIDQEEWEPYVNVQFVMAKKAMGTSGAAGYNVKDSTGFIKFYTTEEFNKQFTHLKNYMGDNIKLKIEENLNG